MTDSLAPQAAPAGPTAPTSEPTRTYWGVVLGAFRSRLTNRVALAWVCVLIMITVAAPFVANGQPYTIVLKEPLPGMTIPGRVWPLFSTLSNIDLGVLTFFFAACIYAYFHRRAAKVFAEVVQVQRYRFRAAFMAALVAALVTVTFFLSRTPYNPPYTYRDYQDLINAGDAHSATFAPIPWHYGDQEPLERKELFEKPPSTDHLLGTDRVGRDVLARLLWSTRVVMGIGFISVGIALVIGVVIGALIGYFARAVDLLGMRVVEIFESVPTFFLILIFIAIYGRQIFMIMIILGLVGWTGIARFVRAEFLKLRKLDFVHAAVASGLSTPRVLFRHMLPNALTPVIVSVTFGVAGAILSESGLSFLGVGVEPPTPSWGAMLNDAGSAADAFRWWMIIPPGVMIFLTVFAYNILGEGLRDAIDPRTSRAR